MGDVWKLPEILNDRAGKIDWWLPNLENRWNKWINNAILLWGLTIKYFMLSAVFNLGERVHPDQTDSTTTSMPSSPAEFFGEEFVSGSIRDQITENAPARFWQFNMKTFYKEQPTTLELATFGIKERRDILLAVSVDLFRYEADKAVDASSSFAREPFIPLPLDLLELQNFGDLDPKWSELPDHSRYYTYYPGRRIYRIKEVLPFPGVFASPPISCIVTADYDLEYREVYVLNQES